MSDIIDSFLRRADHGEGEGKGEGGISMTFEVEGKVLKSHVLNDVCLAAGPCTFLSALYLLCIQR